MEVWFLMFIVSFFQLKYKFHEGIVFWGSVMVTEGSPNVWLLGSQTGIIVSVYSACFPPRPAIMAVDPVPSFAYSLLPGPHGLKMPDWPIIEFLPFCQQWSFSSVAQNPSSRVLHWDSLLAKGECCFAFFWVLLVVAAGFISYCMERTFQWQANTYREAEGRRRSENPWVCSHISPFLQLFIWFSLLSQLHESIRLCSCLDSFEFGVSESLH